MNFKIKLIIFTLCVVILHFVFPALFRNKVNAEISTNDLWTIEVKELNITSDAPAKKQTTIDQPPPIGTYSGTNYKIKSGFGDIPPLAPFSLNISNTLIDYGILSPTNHIYRTTNINISNNNNKGFIVKAYENHPLSDPESNSVIHDSTCDNGSCSEVTGAKWTNTLTYGFGYRCDNVNGKNCPVDFNQNNYYKQFSDISKNEKEQIIMFGNSLPINHEIQITYKVNISKTQHEGSYSNKIIYLAIPEY